MKSRVGSMAALALTGVLALGVPAVAQAGQPSNPGGSHRADHGRGYGKANAGGSSKGQAHRCMPHNRAYVESGTVDATTASTLAENTDGSWSGTLVVDVKNANHMAKADKGQTVTYTFTDAKLAVHFDGGTTGFSAGERVTLIGKEAFLPRRCTASGSAPEPVFRMVVVHPAIS